MGTTSRGGFSLLLHVTEGTLRITGGGAQKEAVFGDLTWGLALFGEVHLLDVGVLGLSVNGYTNFEGGGSTTGAADLRVYAGAAWKFFRLEIGYRYMPFSEVQGGRSRSASTSTAPTPRSRCGSDSELLRRGF
jgi:hypothetical protein